MTANVNARELETKVKDMYREVATNPRGEFHFEMGRAMAARLGYAAADLDRIPQEAIESFAGVGYFFHLADLEVIASERRGPPQHGFLRAAVTVPMDGASPSSAARRRGPIRT